MGRIVRRYIDMFLRRRSSRLLLLVVALCFITLSRQFSLLNHKYGLDYYGSMEPKQILLWTSLFNDANWDSHFTAIGSRSGAIEADPTHYCVLTTNRSLLHTADTVVFHGRDIHMEDLPDFRSPKQRWVYYLLEAPNHSGVVGESGWDQLDQLGFNWTTTYAHFADSPFPYGRMAPTGLLSKSYLTNANNRIDLLADGFSERPKDAIFFDTNCWTQSRRENLVDLLKQAGLSVDIYGKCEGATPLDDVVKTAPAQFFGQYRYYLAFEHSLCDDYASESLFTAMQLASSYGVIPVVYGNANYANLVPLGSFINFNDFNSADRLAKYLISLKDPSEPQNVRNYFEWTSKFAVDRRSYKRLGWQAFCRRLWDFDDLCSHEATRHLPKCANSWKSNLEATLGQCHEPVSELQDYFRFFV